MPIVDPNADHAYHLHPKEYSGDYNPWRREHEPTDHEERQHELAQEDEDSGYNWGPPPPIEHMGGVLRQADQYATRIAEQMAHDPSGVDSADCSCTEPSSHYDDYDKWSNDVDAEREGLEHHATIDDQFSHLPR